MIKYANAAENAPEGSFRPKFKPLMPQKQRAILQALPQRCKERPLQRGAFSNVPNQFGVTPLTISRIWKRVRESTEAGSSVVKISSRKLNCGQKRKEYQCSERLQAIALN